MPGLTSILAKSSEDQFIKLIFGGIVLVFWIGGALISAINKRIEENKRRMKYGKMPAGFTQPVEATPARAGFSAKPPPLKQKQSKRQAKRQAAAAPVAVQASAPPRLSVPAAQAAAPPMAPSRPASAAVPPAQIARLLRRNETLRAAFILNEVLSPPLSLRDGVDSGRRVE